MTTARRAARLAWSAMVLAGPLVPPAQAQEVPAALAGYSMIGERREVVIARDTFAQHWSVRIYLSREGRVFTKQTFESGNPQNGSGSSAMVSNDQNPSQAPFVWDGSGVSRQWTNPRSGVVLTMSMRVIQSGRGLSCRMDLERQNLVGTTIRVTQQSCRIFKGNAVAD